MKEIEPIYTMFLLALVLGASRRDILVWINSGELKTATDGKYISFYEHDVVDFLYRHPECYGRIYCQDLTPFINTERSRIVEKLEQLNNY